MKMASIDHAWWFGLAVWAGIVAQAALVLFNDKYCDFLLSKIYRRSDEPTEKRRVRDARIAAAVVGVAAIYYGFKLFIFGH